MASSSELRAEKEKKEKELKSYRRRKEQVTAIMNSVQSAFEGNIDDINERMNKVVEEQSDGFNNFPYISGVNESISSDKEKSTSSDEKMSSVQSNLSDDNAKTEEKIKALIEEIADLEEAIAAAEAAEAAEALAALQSALGFKK